jgi:DNA ligase (NAD+)
VGEVIANSVMHYFRNADNRRIVERLRAYGLQMSIDRSSAAAGSDALAGKSIVISGVFRHHSRDEYKAIIERNGGKNVGSISSKTSFVLAGDNMGPAKMQKAESLGVPVIDEATFLAMIEGGRASSLDNTEQAEMQTIVGADRRDAPKRPKNEQLSLF